MGLIYLPHRRKSFRSPSIPGFTFVDSDGFASSLGDTTVATPGVTVNVGDLVVVLVTWEVAGTTCTCSDGTASLTEWSNGVYTQISGDPRMDVFYHLSSVASGTNSVIYTATFNGTAEWRQIAVMVFTPNGGAPVSLDGTAAVDSETGTALSSTDITTSGIDGIAFGFYGEYGVSVTSTQINGIASEYSQTSVVLRTAMWSLTYLSGFTGSASGTISSNRWVCGVIAFTK